jgi:hypothetical protein
MSATRRKPKPPAGRRRIPLPRAELLVVITLVFVVAFLGWMAVQVVSLTHELRTANHARDALARQVEGLGGDPVAGPPGSRGEAGESIVGPTGPPGPAGPPGSPGPTGASGRPAPTLTPSPGPAGPPGRDGAPGPTSTIPGPSGPPGSAGQDGAPGEPGQAGPPGAPGQDGSPGQDGQDGSPPAEWTYTDADGVTYRCRPVDDFDPDAPRYTCTPVSGPSSPPAPDPSPTSSTETRTGLLGVRNRPSAGLTSAFVQ